MPFRRKVILLHARKFLRGQFSDRAGHDGVLAAVPEANLALNGRRVKRPGLRQRNRIGGQRGRPMGAGERHALAQRSREPRFGDDFPISCAERPQRRFDRLLRAAAHLPAMKPETEVQQHRRVARDRDQPLGFWRHRVEQRGIFESRRARDDADRRDALP